MSSMDATTEAPAPPIEALMVRTPDAARAVGMAESTFRRRAAAHLTPRPKRVGGSVLYSVRELRMWVRWGCPSRERFENLLAEHDRKGGA